MSTFEINSEALDAAYRAMMGVCDTIESQRARHNQAHSGIEGLLTNAASVVVAATGFDPFSIWEQWGFGGVAQTCSTTNWTVEQVRGTIQQLVREVSEAHRGELAPVLHDRAAYLRSTLDNAQERLQSITSLLNPGNLLHLLTSPWGILDPFSAASGALSLAHSLAQDYRDFLARLSAREKELIEEIRSRFETPTSAALPVTSVHSGSSLQGSNITIQGNSSTLQGGSGYLQGEQAPLTWGQRVGANAKKLEHYLTTTSTGKYRPYNGLDVDALVNSYPPDQRAHSRDLVNKVFQRDPANWLKSDGKTPDVQCVAFVALSYALTTGDPNFLPA
ncbi:MAG TPA: hypothetical protein VFS83_13530, partial [Ktedonobacterales bacterium]|nr:hypothetical protein [Ktedonobacterales bacterium]